MATLNELLSAKAERLESVPGKFASEISKVQLQLLQDIEEILASFDVDSSGHFVISEANMSRAAEMDVLLREALDRTEYAEAVTKFAREFNVQISVSNQYFNQAFPAFTPSQIGEMAVKSAQKTAVELLINTSPDADFIKPIAQQVENAVVNGARWRETLDTIQNITTGNEEVDGKIIQYSKQIAHDTFAVADASYASAVAEEQGATWFFYSGSTIKTSRQFCVERHNDHFCENEIRAWGAGKNTEPSKFEFPKNGEWPGEMEGTNEDTIFSTRGGYLCRHVIMAISIFSVPIEKVKRAIELGFYEPTEFEIQELGLEVAE